MALPINTSYCFERNMVNIEDIIKDANRVPLHPGTHLSDIRGLKSLYSVWIDSEPDDRRSIISNIFTEIELFGDCYRNDGPFIIYIS